MKILKPGETGTGYLVEYDSGYISPELKCPDGVCTNYNLLKEFKSGTNLTLDGPLPDVVEIYAVLQKWGVENKNGRIYPHAERLVGAQRRQPQERLVDRQATPSASSSSTGNGRASSGEAARGREVWTWCSIMVAGLGLAPGG